MSREAGLTAVVAQIAANFGADPPEQKKTPLVTAGVHLEQRLGLAPNEELFSSVYGQVEAAYFAGILDGEGSILWDWHRRMLSLQVVNTSEELMKWLRHYRFGTIRPTPKRAAHHRTCYVWRVSGNRAEWMLRDCLPYLKIKADRARIFLARWEGTGTRKTRWEEEW